MRIKINKTEEVLKHLKLKGEIDTWTAITKFRATRLSAIIFNLKKKGYRITTRDEKNKKTGERYVTYMLEYNIGGRK
jgi:hypothetical protein|tara:strand:+ start:105 stop:335 length:231 start_codon:yes stop_codon:yes gene_type:complete